MTDFLKTVHEAFQPTKGAERVKKLLDGAEVRSITIPTKDGIESIEAVVFHVACFRTESPIELALHLTPFAEEDIGVVAWSVTEVRSGLAAANSYTYPDEALIEAMGKIAIALVVEGAEGFEKRVATMPGSLVGAALQ